ncbi:formate/nitrite transporter family protein [Spiroplasma endosymbiont of Othius punctulatus]|uniref:formate/nitrite transporter family protein n=1 Tax=Spiroplasma endosymbiont of Othius punctulatus TaxID=3066289 RepID=UPI0030D18557
MKSRKNNKPPVEQQEVPKKKERGKAGLYHDMKDLAQKKLSKAEYENQLKNMDYDKVMHGHGYMTDGILGGFSASIHKMEYTFIKQILLGIFSGFIIGFGYTACTYAVMNLGADQNLVERLVMAIIFPFCIVLITFLGGGLYTSHVLATIPTMKGCIKIDHYLKGIFGVLLGNIVGTFLFVSLAAMSGILEDDAFISKAHDIGIHKMYNIGHVISEWRLGGGEHFQYWLALPENTEIAAGTPEAAIAAYEKFVADNNLGRLFETNFDLEGFDISISDVLLTMLFCLGSGILCNIMVSSTLPLTASTKYASATVIIICLPIFLFVMIGLQHGPANTFFLWIFVWELILSIGDPNFQMNTQIVIIACFIFANVLPTLLGNWIGGGLILPGLLHIINIKYTSVFFAKTKYDMDHYTDEY